MVIPSPRISCTPRSHRSAYLWYLCIVHTLRAVAPSKKGFETQIVRDLLGIGWISPVFVGSIRLVEAMLLTLNTAEPPAMHQEEKFRPDPKRLAVEDCHLKRFEVLITFSRGVEDQGL